MENQPLSNLWSQNNHLPEQLWPEILSRLPVKSLLRFRCVSKPWLSLINDPDFCRLHLKNFNNNRDETHLLTAEESGPIKDGVAVRCSDTFEINTDSIITLPPMGPNEYWQFKYPVNGLVLLETLMRDKDIIVWNPSIRKFRVIPSLPKVETFQYAGIGLGYDELGKDYKYVKLIFVDGGIMHSVAIYTLGVGSWNIRQFQGQGFSNWHWYPGYIDNENAVYLRGSLYTLATKKETNVTELVSIDLRSEVFSCSSLPDISYDATGFPRAKLTLVDGGCTLAVFDFEIDMCMWVLEDKSMCWTKRYSFDLNASEFLYLKKNGDMLMLFQNEVTSFTLASGEELAQCLDLVSSYSFVTGQKKILMRRDSFISNMPLVCAYIESLALLK